MVRRIKRQNVLLPRQKWKVRVDGVEYEDWDIEAIVERVTAFRVANRESADDVADEVERQLCEQYPMYAEELEQPVPVVKGDKSVKDWLKDWNKTNRGSIPADLKQNLTPS